MGAGALALTAGLTVPAWAAPANAAQARTAGATGTAGVAGTAGAARTAGAGRPGGSPERQAEALVARMTLDQKIMELHGIQDSQHQRYVPGIPSLGIPPLVVTNGPAGVGPGDDPAQQPATALPAPISLAASFDPALARQYGEVIGKETADLGANLLEGPDVNIVRVYQAGRTFESLSEDPYLDGAIGTAEIQGIQSRRGVIAEVKHFDAYNQEANRNTPADDDIVSTRTLHEIYFPAFEQAVTKGRAQVVMCSYASINGTYSCQDSYLLSSTLRQRWGFDGFVQSDFGATHSTAASAQADMNLEMPTGDYYATAMLQAVQSGEVPVSTIDNLLVQRFAAMIRYGLFGHPSPARPIPAVADGAFARRAAEQGIVLLRNTGDQLPLDARSLHSIALIGPYAGAAMTGGGGSSHVDPLYTVSPVQGIKNAAPGASVSYNDGSDITQAVAAAKAADVAVVMVGDTESEGHDQPSLSLSGNQDQLVEAVAAANPHTVVVVKSGNPVLMPWANQVPAVVEAWYPGEEDGNAVASVLFGTTDPSGKLPVTFPASQSQTPTASPAQYPGTGGKVEYSEGLDVGYRWYDANNVTPQYPFGYGLSYTTFSFSHLKVSTTAVRNGESGPQPAASGNGQGTPLVRVSARVTNTGSRAGADVAQLYLGDPAVAGEPPRQLKGFQKVSLRPGQSTTVHFTLTGHDLSYWDEDANGWVVPDGAFRLYLGDSSALAGLPLHGSFDVTRTVGARYGTVSAPATAAAGSSFTATATFTNDGDYAMPSGRLTLALPTGWTASAGGPRSAALAPHQSVTARWTVHVPASAQGTKGTLTARFGAGPGRSGGRSPRQVTATASVAVDYASLAAAYGNVGITDDGDTAPGNFAGSGTSYSAQQLTAAGLAPGASVTVGGVHLTWPDVPAGRPDNAVASGQTVRLAGHGPTLAILGAADFGSATGTGTLHYTDGTTQSFTLTLADWYANKAAPGTSVVATTPSWNGSTSQHPVSVYGATVPLQAGKSVAAVTLPDVSDGVGENVNAMHVFALGVGG